MNAYERVRARLHFLLYKEVRRRALLHTVSTKRMKVPSRLRSPPILSMNKSARKYHISYLKLFGTKEKLTKIYYH